MLIHRWVDIAGIWQAFGCFNRGLYIGKIKHLCSADITMFWSVWRIHHEQSIKSHCCLDDVWSDNDLSILAEAFCVVSELWGHAMPSSTATEQFLN